MDNIQNWSELLGSNSISQYTIGSPYMENAPALDNFLEAGGLDGVKIQELSIGTAQIGDASITNAKVKNLSVDKLTAGTLGVVANVGAPSGSAGVFLDGVNVRIYTNDGSNPRAVMGNV